MSIKSRQSKPDFQVDARFMYGQLLANGYLEMPVTSLHTVATGDLPMIHKDPFDRILVAQAKVEDVLLLTCDAKIAEYPVQVFFVQK